MSEPREQRRVHAGSTYWIRSASYLGWKVTADGVCIAGPYADYAKAVEALDAVAPQEENRDV